MEFEFESEETHPAEYNITFQVKDEMNNFLFEGSTAFANRIIEKTGPGLYRAKATIPADLMNEGSYSIWRIFFVKDRVTLQFTYEDALSFELKRKVNDEFGYHGPKQGLMLPKIDWKMKYNDKQIIAEN